MKILHLSHHYGCLKDHQYICSQLNFNLESKLSIWNQIIPKDNYIITKDFADKIWKEYSEYFNRFDYIITSDTAPLSRIFIQNIEKVKAKIIVWVCNRFNYNMEGDNEYHQLMKTYSSDPRVKIVPYTEFERIWLKRYDITTQYDTIRPIGLSISEPLNENEQYIMGLDGNYTFDDSKGDVLVSRYHNDNIFQDTKSICQSYGLSANHAKYRGPEELEKVTKNHECFLMFPDAYSKFTAFELMQLKMPVILPTEKFLLQCSVKPGYFFSTGVNSNTVQYCEWYNEYFEKFAVYFEDLEGIPDAVQMVKDNKKEICDIMDTLSKTHKEKTLNQWRQIYD